MIELNEGYVVFSTEEAMSMAKLEKVHVSEEKKKHFKSLGTLKRI